MISPDNLITNSISSILVYSWNKKKFPVLLVDIKHARIQGAFYVLLKVSTDDDKQDGEPFPEIYTWGFFFSFF